MTCTRLENGLLTLVAHVGQVGSVRRRPIPPKRSMSLSVESGGWIDACSVIQPSGCRSGAKNRNVRRLIRIIHRRQWKPNASIHNFCDRYSKTVRLLVTRELPASCCRFGDCFAELLSGWNGVGHSLSVTDSCEATLSDLSEGLSRDGMEGDFSGWGVFWNDLRPGDERSWFLHNTSSRGFVNRYKVVNMIQSRIFGSNCFQIKYSQHLLPCHLHTQCGHSDLDVISHNWKSAASHGFGTSSCRMRDDECKARLNIMWALTYLNCDVQE